MLPTPIEERLPRLSEHYIWRINAAVAAGRMDLVRDLANDCQDEALDLMLALGGGTPSPPTYDAAESWSSVAGGRSDGAPADLAQGGSGSCGTTAVRQCLPSGSTSAAA